MPRGLRIALLLAPALAVVLVLFGGGLVLGVLQSFGYLPFLDGWSWSTDAYRQLVSDPAVRASIGLTFKLAVLATLGAAVLAVAAALALRAVGRGRRLLTAVFQSSLPVPHVVGATGMLLLVAQSGFLARIGHALGLVGAPQDFPALTADAFGWSILAEYLWKETPFIGIVVLAALSSPGVTDLEDAARALGAGPWRRLRTVTLPLLAPAVATTSIIVFAFSFGSYEVPALLGRPYPTTLPVVAYHSYTDVDLGARPLAMAISVVIAVTIGLLVLAYLAITERVLGRRL